MKFKYLIVLLIILLIIVFASYNKNTIIETDEDNKTPYKVNFYHVESLDGGKISILPQDDEDFAVLHVFSTWCKICNNEIKNLKKIQDKYSHINIIGLAMNNNSNDVEKWLKSYDFSYSKLGLLSKEEVEDLDISGVPETLIISKDAEVIFKRKGMLTVNLFEKYVNHVKGQN